MDGLRELATACGVATEYWEWRGRHVAVSAETLTAVLTSLVWTPRRLIAGTRRWKRAASPPGDRFLPPTSSPEPGRPAP
jgi:4-alpha-glucanotransferase